VQYRYGYSNRLDADLVVGSGLRVSEAGTMLTARTPTSCTETRPYSFTSPSPTLAIRVARRPAEF
jgi:hypothetical protein